MNKKGLRSIKALSASLAIVVFLTGFLLIDRGSISGNVIVTSGSSVNKISIIGLFLVFLSAILAAYGLKR